MKYIYHRINDISIIRNLDPQYSCEIDIRYHENNLILWHDPFHHPNHQPCLLDDWLLVYADHFNGETPLILNLKTEGIENICIELMCRHGIKNYFFLDMSMPYFVKYARLAKAGSIDGFSSKNLAIRFSEFEAIEYALSFSKMVEWVCVDCFTKLPLDQMTIKTFQDYHFKTCLVSPELQGHDISLIENFTQQLQALNYTPDAVCTKHPDVWQKVMS